AEEKIKQEMEITSHLLASTLHDIGKIGTYEHLLDKPDKLTDEEFELIKAHPAKGAEILKQIKALKDVIPIVRAHHENTDGTGYPDGLKGNNIPLLARIVHVVDSFDAMTTDRPYRTSFDRGYALKELKRYAGAQFDTEVVKAFLKTGCKR
ncbi:MAG: HD domain-containing protein, partial [Deltaproteobacteria bacterium]|nr:HD domain-containing protein [Deltaproteobacteria bacterium]